MKSYQNRSYRCLVFLIVISFIVKGCSNNNNQHHIDACQEDTVDSSCDCHISDTKYQEIYETIGNYLHHSGMSENEQRKFIYGLCDTIHPCRNSVFFRYSSKINGYNVEGWFGIIPKGSEYESERSVLAVMFFSSDTLTFSLTHSTFQPFKDGFPDTINALDCIELEYNNPVSPNPHKIQLDSIRDFPFAFVDINFDGIKEHLLESPVMDKRQSVHIGRIHCLK